MIDAAVSSIIRVAGRGLRYPRHFPGSVIRCGYVTNSSLPDLGDSGEQPDDLGKSVLAASPADHHGIRPTNQHPGKLGHVILLYQIWASREPPGTAGILIGATAFIHENTNSLPC